MFFPDPYRDREEAAAVSSSIRTATVRERCLLTLRIRCVRPQVIGPTWPRTASDAGRRRRLAAPDTDGCTAVPARKSGSATPRIAESHFPASLEGSTRNRNALNLLPFHPHLLVESGAVCRRDGSARIVRGNRWASDRRRR